MTTQPYVPAALEAGEPDWIGAHSQAGRSDFYAGYALTTVTLAFALHDLALPDPPPTPDSPALAHTAAVAVGSLVGALNDVVTPVIDDRGGQAGESRSEGGRGVERVERQAAHLQCG